MKTHELFGKEVLDSNANRIGKVYDIDFDLQTGKVNLILVRGGIIEKYEIGLDKVDRIGDKVILNTEQAKLG